jgi:tRNA nucleotidyltransferase/poly(A) polymerase
VGEDRLPPGALAADVADPLALLEDGGAARAVDRAVDPAAASSVGLAALTTAPTSWRVMSPRTSSMVLPPKIFSMGEIITPIGGSLNMTKREGKAVEARIRRDRRLREFLNSLASAAGRAGGAAFLAGGWLRDVVDGKPGGDVDVMVSGMSHGKVGEALSTLPAERLGIRKVVPAGRHFPVYRVATSWGAKYVDVAAARGDGRAKGWGPFACALADAARRDFTINSMLYELFPSPKGLRGELIDSFGGVADLARRTIRCVGSPEDRLREDPVRALRAIRMKNERKGYRIDPKTFAAVRRLGPRLLAGVPADRIPAELIRSFRATPPGTFDDLLRSGILRALLPELARKRSGAQRARRRYAALSRAGSGAPLPETILLSNLLLDLPPAQAEEAARRLRFPGVRRILSTVLDLRLLRDPSRMRYPLARTEAILARQEAPEAFIALYRAAAACDGARPTDLKRFIIRCKKTPVFIDGIDLTAIGSGGAGAGGNAARGPRGVACGEGEGREAALKMIRATREKTRAARRNRPSEGSTPKGVRAR